MKNLVKSLIFAFSLSIVCTFNASADEKDAKKVTGFGSGIYTSREGKIMINIDKFNQKSTVIVLENQNGKVLYHEVTGKNELKLRRKLDMSQLPAGEYTLRISSDGEKQVKKLELSEKQPERLISMK